MFNGVAAVCTRIKARRRAFGRIVHRANSHFDLIRFRFFNRNLEIAALRFVPATRPNVRASRQFFDKCEPAKAWLLHVDVKAKLRFEVRSKFVVFLSVSFFPATETQSLYRRSKWVCSIGQICWIARANR